MARWGICLFGNEHLFETGADAVAVPDICWPIVGCLVAAPRHRTARSRLAAQLWPDDSEDTIRRRLATALWRIRTRLGPRATLISTTGESVALGLTNLWIDVLAFERRARIALADPAKLAGVDERRRLARAVRLYRGDFLAARDQEWIVLERARLRAMFLDASYELAIASARAGDWPAAQSAAGALCMAEPLREDAQRLLIEAHARCGNRALALQQYRRCMHVLREELGVEPMPETRCLAASLAEPEAVDGDQGHTSSRERRALVDARASIVQSLRVIDHALRA